MIWAMAGDDAELPWAGRHRRHASTTKCHRVITQLSTTGSPSRGYLPLRAFLASCYAGFISSPAGLSSFSRSSHVSRLTTFPLPASLPSPSAAAWLFAPASAARKILAYLLKRDALSFRLGGAAHALRRLAGAYAHAHAGRAARRRRRLRVRP